MMTLRTLIMSSALLFAATSGAATPDWMTSPRASVLVVGGAMMNGNHFADDTLPAMREHFAGRRTIALVLHASHPEDRDKMELRLQEAFAHLGGQTAFSLHRFDTAEANLRLAQADGIFVGGGDTFWLLRELYETGQLGLIRERVLAGVPYAGSSAGANIAGVVIGATNDFPVTDVPTRRALAILPVVINPHHPRADEQPAYDSRAWKIRNYLRFNPHERVLALGDRAMVRLHEGEITVALGPVWDYRPGDTAPAETGQALPLAEPNS